MICFALQPSQVTAQQWISTMLVFVQVNAAQIVTAREIRNVVVMAVVVSAVLLHDKVNTDIFTELHLLMRHKKSVFFFSISNLFCFATPRETLVLKLILK